ncbi:hypothetical protein VTI28DRAFT_7921 [Corynascus sepedonium]
MFIDGRCRVKEQGERERAAASIVYGRHWSSGNGKKVFNDREETTRTPSMQKVCKKKKDIGSLQFVIGSKEWLTVVLEEMMGKERRCSPMVPAGLCDSERCCSGGRLTGATNRWKSRNDGEAGLAAERGPKTAIQEGFVPGVSGLVGSQSTRCWGLSSCGPGTE